MFKLMVLYQKPDDPAAFMKHFQELHLPLARAIPGLEKVEINAVDMQIGAPRYFLISELHFRDRATLEGALKSPENRAAGADLANFTSSPPDFLVAEVLD